jgi:hypothetical protein
MKSYRNLQLTPEKEGFEVKDVVKPLLPVSLSSYEFGLVKRLVTLGCVQFKALMAGENALSSFYREPALFAENNNYLLKGVT